MLEAFAPLGFGAAGWGRLLLLAAATTVAVSAVAYVVGIGIGALGAWAKLAGPLPVRALAGAYTTVFRGVPDLLVIYLFYFGGSAVLTGAARLFGSDGFVGLPAFVVGVAAIGIVSGAYQTEVLRAAYGAIPRGQVEAARVCGMSGALLLRRIVTPLLLRTALPGLGNVWQMVLKESALVSVTGLVELMRQTLIAANSTRLPFLFYGAAGVLYLLITTASGALFNLAERRAGRGTAASLQQRPA